MKTTTIIDERELYYTLSKLISNNPFKQVEWVQDVLKNPFSKSFICNMEGLKPIKESETYLNKAGLFMLVGVYEDEEVKKREIAEVEFYEDIEDIEVYLSNIYDVENFTYKNYRLFYYDKSDGYTEIPYSIGEYEIYKSTGYCDLETGLIPEPKTTYYEGDSDDCIEGWQANKRFFLEIPNLYEIELGYIEDDEQGFDSGIGTKQYYFFKSFAKALDHATKELLHFSTEYDRVILSNRWYSFYLYRSIEDRKELEDSFGSFKFKVPTVEIEIIIKFNE